MQKCDVERLGRAGMSKFDSREDYENWKSRNALKRLGKAELERSDREWAKNEPHAGTKRGGGWVWLVILAAVIVVIVLYTVKKG